MKKSKIQIVKTSPFDLSPEQDARLQACGEVEGYVTEPSDAKDWLLRCEGKSIVCSGKSGMTKSVTPSDPSDLAIYHLAVGTLVSHPFVNVADIDIDRLQRAGVRLAFAPGCNCQPVAEAVVWDIIELFREFRTAANLVDPAVKLQRAMSLFGKKAAILGGKGNVGRAVTERLVPFGMDVVCYIRPGTILDVKDRVQGAHYTSDLFEALSGARVVVNCLSSLAGNKAMLDADFFRSMMKGSFFITMTSPFVRDPAMPDFKKGPWVAEDLLAALEEGHLAGAAIDVGSGTAGDVSAPVYRMVVGRPGVKIATPQIYHFADVAAKQSYDMMIKNVQAAVLDEPIPYLYA